MILTYILSYQKRLWEVIFLGVRTLKTDSLFYTISAYKSFPKNALLSDGGGNLDSQGA